MTTEFLELDDTHLPQSDNAKEQAKGRNNLGDVNGPTPTNDKESFASKAKRQPKQKQEGEDENQSNFSNILIVGDSHLHNLDNAILKEASKAVIEKAIAYTVDEDKDAKYPKRNFLKIVPERLSRKPYDTLILQGGCNEITNIDVKQNAATNIKQ